jgi:hypothetical protein
MSKLIENYEELTKLKTKMYPFGDMVLVMASCSNLKTLSLINNSPGNFNIDSLILIGCDESFTIPLGTKLLMKSSFYVGDDGNPATLFNYIVRTLDNPRSVKTIIEQVKGLSKAEYQEFISNNKEVAFTEFLLVPNYHIAAYYDN